MLGITYVFTKIASDNCQPGHSSWRSNTDFFIFRTHNRSTLSFLSTFHRCTSIDLERRLVTFDILCGEPDVRKKGTQLVLYVHQAPAAAAAAIDSSPPPPNLVWRNGTGVDSYSARGFSISYMKVDCNLLLTLQYKFIKWFFIRLILKFRPRCIARTCNSLRVSGLGAS
jgi:hypothetical protein